MADKLPPRRTPVVEPEKIARRYQLEVLKRAINYNTIIYLETGCGKTLIAVLLIRALSHLFRKPSKGICVFLVPTTCICKQQAEYIKFYTDLFVGEYHGTGISSLSPQKWKEELEKVEVFVMTPMILLRNLRHCFFNKEDVKLLIFDECHHASNSHPYAAIMKEFYHDHLGKGTRIFGMTASPLTGKGNSALGLETYERVIEELETMLNCKIYTVKEKAEVDIYAPSPAVEIKYYARTSQMAYLREKLFLLTQEHTKQQQRSRRFRRDRIDLSFTIAKENIQTIYRLYGSLEYCLKELGLWCATQAVKILMKDEAKDSPVTEELISLDEYKVNFLNEAFDLLNTALMQDGTILSEMQDDDWGDGCSVISTKVQALLSLLHSNKNLVTLKCIIFVERVIASCLVKLLIGQIPCFTYLKCESLAGRQSTYAGKSYTKQQEVIRLFQSSEVNLLIATNVAEEGLDIQTCCLVVRFDLPKTERSLIQSKGRARKQGSEYIVLIEAGNSVEENTFLSVMRGETLLQEQARQSAELSILKDHVHINKDEVYTVDSTGARVNLDSSVTLLYHYCAKSSGQRFYEMRPKFSYYSDDDGVVCTVKIPGNEPVFKVTGNKCKTSSFAKKSACLEACRRLHCSGALTDHLIPVSTMEFDPIYLGACKTHKKETKQYVEMENFETLVPDVLSGCWDASSGSIVLHAYLLSFGSVPAGQEYRNLYLFLQSELDSDTAHMTVEFHLVQGNVVTAHLQPSGDVALDKHEIDVAKTFQEKLFNVVFDWEVYSSPVEALLTGDANTWNCSRMYLLLPQLQHLEELNPSEIRIDWNLIRNCSSPISSLAGSDVFLSEGCVKEDELMHFANASVPASLAVNAYVVTLHNGMPYLIEDVLYGYTSASAFKARPKDYTSYEDYFSKRYNINVQHLHQPLLKAKRVRRPQNLLNRPASVPSEINKTDASVELPPDICSLKLVGLSTGLINALALVPSLMHRMENVFVAAQLRKKFIAGFQEGGRILISTVLEALTTLKCNEKFSLQSLEMLGDSCLKFAVTQHLFLIHEDEDEGKLSQRRAQEISNSNLYILGAAKDIPMHLRDWCFNPAEWPAPGRVVHNSKCSEDSSKLDTNSTKRYHEVKRKTIADVVEALIGGYLVDGGLKAAIDYMQWLGLQVHFDPTLLAEMYAYSEQDVLYGKLNFAEVERTLGYSFRNKSLLVQALTHASCQQSKNNYQRLEFLGDAVLDVLISLHLYSTFPGLKPGILSDLRSATVNNWSLSLVTVRYKFYEFLLESAPQLMPCIMMFLAESYQSPHKWEDDGAPKVLADLLEALAGAVFLDTGSDLVKVWSIFEPLLQPIASPQTLQIHPVRELYELCQFHGFELSYSYEVLTVDEKRLTAKVEKETMKSTIAQGVVSSPINMRNKVNKIRVAKDVLEKLKSQGWLHPCHKLAALKQACSLQDCSSLKQGLVDSGLLINNDVETCKLPIKADLVSRFNYPISDLSENANKVTGLPTPELFKNDDIREDAKGCNQVKIVTKYEPTTACTSNTQVHHQSPCNAQMWHEISGFGSGTTSPMLQPENASLENAVYLKEKCNHHCQATAIESNCEKRSSFHPAPLNNESVLESACSAMKKLSAGCHQSSDQFSNLRGSSSTDSFLESDSRTKSYVRRYEIENIANLLRPQPKNDKEQGQSILNLLNSTPNKAPISTTEVGHVQSQGKPRSELYEFCAKYQWSSPDFFCLGEQGPPNMRLFTFGVIIALPDNKYMKFSGEPMGNHNAAKDSAAESALLWLSDNIASILCPFAIAD